MRLSPRREATHTLPCLRGRVRAEGAGLGAAPLKDANFAGLGAVLPTGLGAALTLALALTACAGEAPTPPPTTPVETPSPTPDAALHVVNGMASSVEGRPLPGVIVRLGGAQVATTDGEGLYEATSIRIREDARLDFDLTGYTFDTRALSVDADTVLTFDVSLKDMDWTGTTVGGVTQVTDSSGLDVQIDAAGYLDPSGLPVTGIVEILHIAAAGADELGILPGAPAFTDAALAAAQVRMLHAGQPVTPAGEATLCLPLLDHARAPEGTLTSLLLYTRDADRWDWAAPAVITNDAEGSCASAPLTTSGAYAVLPVDPIPCACGGQLGVGQPILSTDGAGRRGQVICGGGDDAHVLLVRWEGQSAQTLNPQAAAFCACPTESPLLGAFTTGEMAWVGCDDVAPDPAAGSACGGQVCVDDDGDGYDTRTDCDDADPTINPAEPEACDGEDDDCDGRIDEYTGIALYIDADGDGAGDSAQPVERCTKEAGTSLEGGDCDDQDPTRYPGAWEVCDGVDQDCDGDVDEGRTVDLYRDQDRDGYGAGVPQTRDCDGQAGLSSAPGDCDDQDAGIRPGAVETCDGVDQDCDGRVDEGQVKTRFPDLDGDGFGDVSGPVPYCIGDEGGVGSGGDCDDGDPLVHPEEDEICDGADQDCDGSIDEGLLIAAFTDRDGDGYGTLPQVQVCKLEGGLAALGGDCQDGNPAIHPGAEEIPGNGSDDDCDGQADEPPTPTPSPGACIPLGEEDRLFTEPCLSSNDGAPFTGAVKARTAVSYALAVDVTRELTLRRVELRGGGTERQTRVLIYRAGADGGPGALLAISPFFFVHLAEDWYGANLSAPLTVSAGERIFLSFELIDKGELLPAVTSGAETPFCLKQARLASPSPWSCGYRGKWAWRLFCSPCDGVDDDCDGAVDEDIVSRAWQDADGDGFGDVELYTDVPGCDLPQGTTLEPGDCDDGDPLINPEAVEVFGGGDEDCDGSYDEGPPQPTPEACVDVDLGSGRDVEGPLFSGDNFDALPELIGSCGGDGAEVVFSWTAPFTGFFSFHTAGSDFDTVLYLLDGCGGEELACSDDDEELGIQSYLEMPLEGGRPLTIVVDAYDLADRGAFNLGIRGFVDEDPPTPTPPDLSCAAEDLGEATGPAVNQLVVDNLAAPAQRRGGCGGGGPEIVFRWQAAATGDVTFDTQGSDFDTVLYLLSDCGGQELACNDDDVGLQSRLTTSVTAGQELLIVVDSFNAEALGALVLNTSAITPQPDLDLDGYDGVDDCDNLDPLIHPGALDPCGDGVDQDCDGVDLLCGE